MKYPKFLAATKAQEIPAIVAGLPISVEGFIVSENDIANVEAALEAAETVTATVAALQENVNTANATLATAEAAQQTAETALTTANTTIATHVARIAELEKITGTAGGNAPVVDEDEERNAKVKANDMGFQKDLYEMV